MSHPKNKRDRFLAGVRKGKKRVALWFISDYWYLNEAKRKETMEWHEGHHRDTTKRCGRRCCANPRTEGEKTLQELKADERDNGEIR